MNAFIVFAALVLGCGSSNTSTASSSRQFVPNCRVILFGDVLEQVPSDDGKSLGTLIERTQDAVLINGRVWVSKDEKPKQLKHPDERIQRKGLVIEEAARQFRAQQKDVGEGRYSASGQVYDNTPQPFHVELYDETVELAVKPGVAGMDYIYVTYDGTTAGMPLNPLPSPSKEEQERTRLDNAYQAAVNYARSGTIIFVTHGHFTPYPLEKAESFIAAMRKVPSLAVPVAEDIYGEMTYRMLTVDGFIFDGQMVAVIMQRERGRER